MTGRTRASRMHADARLAWGTLALGLFFCGVYVMTADHTAGYWTYLLAAAYGTALSCFGAYRMPPGHRRAWWAMAAGQALFLTGDLLYTAIELTAGSVPHPSIADLGYLACYPALALGLLWLVRSRRRGSDRAAYLDASILATALTVAGTVFIVGPAATNTGYDWLGEVVATAYPAVDLLVLALVVRLLSTGMLRNLSLWALIAGLALLLGADLGYIAAVLAGVEYAGWVDPTYLASYVLVGCAVLHPSAHAISEPSTEPARSIHVGRLAWLGAALVLTPVTEYVAGLIDGRAHRGSVTLLLGGVLIAIFVLLRIADLVQQLQRQTVQLATLARKDGLTGVANRRSWDHELSRAGAFARETGTALSAAVLDMDHFKRFNDAHGHAMGDLVLKETTAAWSAIVDGHGFLARYGGEEFGVLLPGMTAAEAEALLDRMRRAVTHGQTCSIGVARWLPGDEPSGLVARADEALYHAKNAGRNRIAVHDGGAAPPLVVSPAVAAPAGLPAATTYLPIVDLVTGDVMGSRALATTDKRGVRAAVSGWDGVGMLILGIRLDVLGAPEVQACLPEDLSPIVLDLVEAEPMAGDSGVGRALDVLRARGASIAVEDLRGARSAIHRMLLLRPDVTKVDMAVLREGEPVVVDALLEAAVLFSQRTGSTVVAENVVTAEERDRLIRAGVQMGHGPALLAEDSPSRSSRAAAHALR